MNINMHTTKLEFNTWEDYNEKDEEHTDNHHQNVDSDHSRIEDHQNIDSDYSRIEDHELSIDATEPRLINGKTINNDKNHIYYSKNENYKKDHELPLESQVGLRESGILELLQNDDLINYFSNYIPKTPETHYYTMNEFRKDWTRAWQNKNGLGKLQIDKKFVSKAFPLKYITPIIGKILNSPELASDILYFLSLDTNTLKNNKGNIPYLFRQRLVAKISKFSPIKIKSTNPKYLTLEYTRDSTNRTIRNEIESSLHRSINKYDGSVLLDLIKGFINQTLKIDAQYSIRTKTGICFQDKKKKKTKNQKKNRKNEENYEDNVLLNLETNFNQFLINPVNPIYVRLHPQRTQFSIGETLHFIVYLIFLDIIHSEIPIKENKDFYLYHLFENIDDDSNDDSNDDSDDDSETDLNNFLDLKIQSLFTFIQLCIKYKNCNQKLNENALKNNLWIDFCNQAKLYFPRIFTFLFPKTFKQISDGTSSRHSSVIIQKTDNCFKLFQNFKQLEKNELNNTIEIWLITLIHKVKFYLTLLDFPLSYVKTLTYFSVNFNDQIRFFCNSLSRKKNIAKKLCATFDRISDFIKIFQLSDLSLKNSFGFKHIIELWQDLTPIKIEYLLKYKSVNSQSLCPVFIGFDNNSATPRQFQIDMINWAKIDNNPLLVCLAPTGSGKTTTITILKYIESRTHLKYIAPKDIGIQIAHLLGNKFLSNCSGIISFYLGPRWTTCGVGGVVFDLCKNNKSDEIKSKKAKHFQQKGGGQSSSLTRKVKEAKRMETLGFSNEKLDEKKYKELEENDRHVADILQKNSFVTIAQPIFVPNDKQGKPKIICLDDVSIPNLPKEFQNGSIHFHKKSLLFYFKENQQIKYFSENQQINILKAFLILQNTYVNQTKIVATNQNSKLLLVGATLPKILVDFTKNLFRFFEIPIPNCDISKTVYAGNWNIYTYYKKKAVHFPWTLFFKEHGNVYNEKKPNTNIKRAIVTDPQFYKTLRTLKPVTDWDKRSTLNNFQKIINTYINLESESYSLSELDEQFYKKSSTLVKRAIQEFKYWREINDNANKGNVDAIQDINKLGLENFNNWCTLVISKNSAKFALQHKPNKKKKEENKWHFLKESNYDLILKTITEIIQFFETYEEIQETKKTVIKYARTKKEANRQLKSLEKIDKKIKVDPKKDFFDKFQIEFDMCNTIFTTLNETKFDFKPIENKWHLYFLLIHGICNYQIFNSAPNILKLKYVYILFFDASDPSSDIHGFDYKYINRFYIQDGFQGYLIAQALGRLGRGRQDELDDLASRSYVSYKSILALFEFENKETESDKTLKSFIKLFEDNMPKIGSQIDWNQTNLVISKIASNFKFTLSKESKLSSKFSLANNNSLRKNLPTKDKSLVTSSLTLADLDLDLDDLFLEALNINQEPQRVDSDKNKSIILEIINNITHHPNSSEEYNMIEECSIFTIIMALSYSLLDKLKNPNLAKNCWLKSLEYREIFFKEVNLLVNKNQSYSTLLQNILELQLCIKHALLIFKKTFDKSIFQNFLSTELTKLDQINQILEFNVNEQFSPNWKNKPIDLNRYSEIITRFVMYHWFKSCQNNIYHNFTSYIKLTKWMTGNQSICKELNLNKMCINPNCRSPHYFSFKHFKKILYQDTKPVSQKSQKNTNHVKTIKSQIATEDEAKLADSALRGYEHFHELPHESATLGQVMNTSAGVDGFAEYGNRERNKPGKSPSTLRVKTITIKDGHLGTFGSENKSPSTIGNLRSTPRVKTNKSPSTKKQTKKGKGKWKKKSKKK
jgi:hypothetical protein